MPYPGANGVMCSRQWELTIGRAIGKGQLQAQQLDRLHQYVTELPKELLDQAVSIQGDRSRLHRVLMRLLKGQPVKIALMGGSLSIRGWNNQDEAYIRQVHKWLEIAFVPGCLEEAQQAAAPYLQGIAPTNPTAAPTEQGAPQPLFVRRSASKKLGNDQERHHVPARRHLASVGSNSNETTGATDASMTSAAVNMPAAAATAAAAAARRLALDNGDVAMPDPLPDLRHDLHVRSHAAYLQTGHMCSTSNIDLISLAVPAAGPGYAERCIAQHLPEDVDLVLLDFALNDYFNGDQLDHPERRAYERILRYTLTLPKRPAVMLFEAFSWEQAAGDFIGRKVSLGQDKHSLIAEYYGSIQVISARAALFQLLRATNHSGRLIHIGKGHDMTHVSLLGHRWYADLIINYLRGEATNLLTRLITTTALQQSGSLGAGARALQAQLAAINTSTSSSDGSSGGGGSGSGRSSSTEAGASSEGQCEVLGARGARYSLNCSSSSLRHPLFPGNEFSGFGICAVGVDFEDVVTGHEGWEWVDESPAGHDVHKYGYVSHKVGSKLVIDVGLDNLWPATASTSHSLRDGDGSTDSHASSDVDEDDDGSQSKADRALRVQTEPALAWLIYLQSYHGVGTASVRCSLGCRCQASTINALVEDKIKATVPALHMFFIHHVPGIQDKCRLEVEYQKEADGGSSKFKVIGLTTSNKPVWHLDEIIKRGNNAWGQGEG